ncbi:MAG: nitrogenase component 1, partial [Puniceicoccales bacterium]
VSFFGFEDTARAIYTAAEHFGDPELMRRAEELVREEISKYAPKLKEYKKRLKDKKAALYVGGAFKAFSLVLALRALGMKTVLAGTQTGSAEDYEQLKEICDPGTVIVDDSNPLELAKFVLEKDVDLFIGGVKERPIAFKLGVAFCDHNHERKIPLAGFEGMVHFAEEVANSACSPIWQFAPRRQAKALRLPEAEATTPLAREEGGAA